MNAEVSVRPEGIACDAGHAIAEPTPRPQAQRLASLWMLAANQVMQTLGRSAHAYPVSLFVTPEGNLYAVRDGEDPPNGVYVCRINHKTDAVVVAARLRHATSRWRNESADTSAVDAD